MRERLTEHIYIATDEKEITAQLESAFALMIESKPLRRRLKKENHAQPDGQPFAAWLADLRGLGGGERGRSRFARANPGSGCQSD